MRIVDLDGQKGHTGLHKSMEAFGICARGLATAVQFLVHPLAVIPEELMDLLR